MRNKLRKRQYENEVSWSTSTWLALQAQRLSVAVHISTYKLRRAWEIATEMQLAGGGGARRPSLMRRAPPRRESAPYFVGPSCVFVCVCVCLCVYSRVGASYVGRPICVCAVSAPLRTMRPLGGAERASSRVFRISREENTSNNPPATDVAGGCRYTRYLRHGTIRDEHKT